MLSPRVEREEKRCKEDSNLRLVQSTEERDYYDHNKWVYTYFAPFYDWVARPLREFRRRVVKIAGLSGNSRILDVATGTGAQAVAFARMGYRVTGIDISDSMLGIAHRKHRLPNLTFQRADATKLEFEDGSFDASTISFAFHEMPRSIREKVIAEIDLTSI